MRTSLAVIMATLAALPLVIPAQAKTQVGVLTCQIEGGTGLIIGSKKGMRCLFDPAGKGAKQTYTGEISRVGLDVGYTGKAVMTWAVLAPSERLGKGALRGTYIGASGEASVGIGAGVNALVGGSNKTISLQPLSVKGQTGLNAALGVAELELR